MIRMLLAAVVLGMGAVPTVAAAGPLDTLRWNNRIVLVFAQGDERQAERQRAELAGNRGVAERELVLVMVPATGKVDVDGAGTLEAAALRHAYSIAADAPFTVLLVGKDGGVKRRATQPIGAADLFATIDAMPMRANEMRRG